MDYNFFSRNQCTIEWKSKENNWRLFDGFNNKTSSYGTW